MAERLRDLLAELRRRFEALYGPRLVGLVLYGSQARGDAEQGSDIDVLVVLEGPVRPGEEIRRTLNDVTELSLDNNVVFSCVFDFTRPVRERTESAAHQCQTRGRAGMTDAQERLLRQAHASHSAAKLLRQEGHYGFAAARAYYTMFYIAEAFLLDKGL